MRNPGSRRGGILAGLMLTGICLLCLATIGALYLARNVRIQTATHNGRDAVSVDTPVGHLSVLAHERTGAAFAEVPGYPGAHAEESGGDAVVQWTSKDGARARDFGFSASSAVTSDPPDKVVDYYRTQLPGWVLITEKDGTVRLELSKGGYKRFVAIHADDDGTHIAVASAGEPASN